MQAVNSFSLDLGLRNFYPPLNKTLIISGATPPFAQILRYSLLELVEQILLPKELNPYRSD